MTEIRGVFPAIASPFTSSGEVDYQSYENLIRTLIKGGCHGIALFATAGEYYKLNEEEARNLLAITVDECRRGGVASLVSVTQHPTELAIQMAKDFESAGADCLMLLPPFFLQPTAEDMLDHIRSVAKAVNLPIMVQYAPDQTQVNIAPAVLAHLLSEVEYLEYFRIECSPPGAYISTLLKETEDQAQVFVGNAGYQMIEGFDRGAIGVMPGCSMFDIYLKIYNHLQEGNREEAIQIHNSLLAMLNHISQSVEMIIGYEKKILHKRGIIATDYCRRPTFRTDVVYEALFEEYYGQIRSYFDQL